MLTERQRFLYTFIVEEPLSSKIDICSAFCHTCEGCDNKEAAYGDRVYSRCCASGIIHECSSGKEDGYSTSGACFASFADLESSASLICRITGKLSTVTCFEEAPTRRDREEAFEAGSTGTRVDVCNNDTKTAEEKRLVQEKRQDASTAKAQALVPAVALMLSDALAGDTDSRCRSVLTRLFASEIRANMTRATNLTLDPLLTRPGFTEKHCADLHENVMRFLKTRIRGFIMKDELCVAILYLTLVDGDTCGGFFPNGACVHLSTYAPTRDSLPDYGYSKRTLASQITLVCSQTALALRTANKKSKRKKQKTASLTNEDRIDNLAHSLSLR
jgi:hypothetical protein